jgi:hypothetical protein
LITDPAWSSAASADAYAEKAGVQVEDPCLVVDRVDDDRDGGDV